MSTIKRKTIVFNTEDPLQKELWEHVSKFKNFSYYGKSLIQKDMEKNPITRNKTYHSDGGIEVRVGNNKKKM